MLWLILRYLKMSQTELAASYRAHMTTTLKKFDGSEGLPARSKITNFLFQVHSDLGQEEKALSLFHDAAQEGVSPLFWSDQHYFHQNIIKYTNRPLEHNADMNNLMTKNYHEKVTDTDLVVFGGDFFMGNKEAALAILRAMPGRKICILGNHDFDYKRAMVKMLLDTTLFDAVVSHLAVVLEEQEYWLTHYPIRTQFLPKNVKNIHGHIHNLKVESNSHLNMSVEIVNYCPVSLQDLITLNK